MRGTRKIAAVLLTAVMLNTLTGCSLSTFKESWQTLLGKSESNTLTAAQMQEMKDKKVIRNVDENLAAPEFTLNLGDTHTYQVGAGAEALTVEATAPEGTITYQWYQNTADLNGGGQAIEGATEATYTPDTSEKGTTYYFCVATVTVDDRIREATSLTSAVVVQDVADVSVIAGEQLNEQ